MVAINLYSNVISAEKLIIEKSILPSTVSKFFNQKLFKDTKYEYSFEKDENEILKKYDCVLASEIKNLKKENTRATLRRKVRQTIGKFTFFSIKILLYSACLE